MAAKPLTTEAIALTEKKMDMALDDIIKLSKTAGTKSKSKQRIPNKNNKLLNNKPQDKAMKVQRFMDSRSSLRQGALAKRRSSFKGNQFPLAAEAAQRAVVAPLHNRAFGNNRVPNWNTQRVGAPIVHRRPANGGFTLKQQRYQAQPQNQRFQSQPLNQQQGNTVPKQRPQTLDSMFANMREQRMRVVSNHNNVPTHNGGGQQRQQPWRRGRFGN